MPASNYGLPGTGKIRTIVGTNPSAGVNISETVPAGKKWRLIYFKTVLVSDATVINRNTQLRLDDGTNIFAQSSTGFSQVASTTIHITFFAGGEKGDAGALTVHGALAPNVFLLGGYRILSTTTNLQAGDDYAGPIYCVEEWDL